jgi:divalent metal cation (Fe/Co/Zn/Cd) transporter
VSTEQRPLDLRLVVLVIAISAPLALGVETLMRTQVLAPMLGPSFDEVREFFSPQLTRVAWAMVAVTFAAGILGIVITQLAVRKLARLPDPALRARKLRDRLLLLTSIPQVPAILATLCFTCGARLFPVLVAMVVSTLFVLIQGFVGNWTLERDAQKHSDPSGSGNASRSSMLAR